MTVSHFTIDGKAYVIIERDEYQELKMSSYKTDFPEIPPRGKHGYPAVQLGWATIGRDVIVKRRKAGLSLKDVARLAGIRVETLCRIEKGKHIPSIKSIDRIEAALKGHSSKSKSRKRTLSTK